MTICPVHPRIANKIIIINELGENSSLYPSEGGLAFYHHKFQLDF